MKNKTTIGLTAHVTLFGKNAKKEIIARIDTGATKSSVDQKLADELQLGAELKQILIKSAHGSRHRGVVLAQVNIAGTVTTAEFTLADRSHMKYKVLIGQNILKKGFMIDPSRP
ncbi:ATP-dependent zinc protease [Candidatus Woesearchaeota archaeon]|nr:ATP-dependent zinc protease [Candidatus Woesearchaeota archaeon]